MVVMMNQFTVSKKISFVLLASARLRAMANTIDDERGDPFLSLNDSHIEADDINEMNSGDDTDEVMDIS